MMLLLSACNKDKEDVEEEPLTFNTSEYCDDSCYFSGDGECDDGGPGADSEYCKFGTDCTDCGVRIVKEVDR